jgi:hypothetical protein
MQAQVETLDLELEVNSDATTDSAVELKELELALVGGGAGDVYF